VRRNDDDGTTLAKTVATCLAQFHGVRKVMVSECVFEGFGAA
jgi:hypothetical protein